MSVKTETLSSFLSDVEYPSTAEIEKDWLSHDKVRWAAILPCCLLLLFFGLGNSLSIGCAKTALGRDAFLGWDWVLDTTKVLMVASSSLGFVLIPVVLYAFSSRVRFLIVLYGFTVSAFLVMISTLETVLNPELFIIAFTMDAIFTALLLHTVYIIMCSWFPDLVTVMTSVQCAVLFLSYLFHNTFIAYLQYLLGIPVSTFLFHFIRFAIMYVAMTDTTVAPDYLETFINAVIVATTASANIESQQGMPNFDSSSNQTTQTALHSSLKLTARLPQAVMRLKKLKQLIKNKRRGGYGELVDETHAREREMVEMHIAQAFDESDVETTVPYKGGSNFGDMVDSDLEDVQDRKDVLLEASKSKVPSQHRRKGDSDDENSKDQHFSITVSDSNDRQQNENHEPLASAPRPPQRTMTGTKYEMGKSLKNVVAGMDKFLPLSVAELVVQYPVRYLLLLTLLAPVFPLCLVFSTPELFQHLFNAHPDDAWKLRYSVFIAMCVTMSLVGLPAQIFGHKSQHKIALGTQFVCAILWEHVVTSGSNKSVIAIVIILSIALATNLTLVTPMAYKYLYSENTATSTGLVFATISTTACAAIAFLQFVRTPIVENLHQPYTGPQLNTNAYNWCARIAIVLTIVAFYFVSKLKHLSMSDRTHA